MSAQSLFRQIESHELAAKLNVASDLRTFLRGASQEEAIQHLSKELRAPSFREETAARAITLASTRVDPRYENPADTALTLYVWLLSLKDLPMARLAADAVVNAQNCWWGIRVARDVLLGRRHESETMYRDFEIILRHAAPMPRVYFRNAAGEALSLATFQFGSGLSQPIQAGFSLFQIGEKTGTVLMNLWSEELESPYAFYLRDTKVEVRDTLRAVAS